MCGHFWIINTVPDFCNRESNTVKISVFTDFPRNAYVENYIFLNEAKQLMSQTSFSAIIDNSSSFMSIDPQNVALEQLRQNNDLLKWRRTSWNPQKQQQYVY